MIAEYFVSEETSQHNDNSWYSRTDSFLDLNWLAG